MRIRQQLRPHLKPVAWWTLLCAVFFSPFLLGREYFSGGDISGQFHAFALFQARAMTSGQLPLWSPGSFGGIPFAADPQAAVFYPLRWLTILLSWPWDFPFYALELEAIAHVWLAGLFTYTLAADMTGKRQAGLMAAVVFGLGGFVASYPLSQLAILEAITWLPLALFLVRRAAQATRPVRWLLGTGVALGLSLLAGHPQTFLHVSYLTVAYYLFQTLQARWSWRWLLGLGLIPALTAVGMATAAWLPAIRFAGATVRSQVNYQFVATGLPLLDYLHILVPGSLSSLSNTYLGVGGLALGLIAWWGRKRGGKRQQHEITFWAITTLIAAWLALGDKGILFELVYHIAPGFSLFRQQERLLGIFSLSGAMLAAQGMAIWLACGGEERKRLARHVGVWMGGGLLVAALFLLAAEPSTTWPVTWGLQIVLTAVVLLLLRLPSRGTWLSLSLLILLAVDLYRPTLTAIERQPGTPATYWPQPEWLTALASDEPSRIDSSRVYFANVGEIYGLEDIRGISPLKPQFLADYEQLPIIRRWQLLNVTHVLTHDPPADAPLTQTAVADESLWPNNQFEIPVYRFEAALPRAWMSYEPVRMPDAASAYQQIQNPEFDPARQVVLHTAVAGQATPPGTPPTVHIQRQGVSGLDITVATETAGFLVISEWAYPGWQATVNGAATPIHPANYALQAIWLPAGQHDIRLRFAPLDVTVGLIISALTVLAAGLAAWRWRPLVTAATRPRPVPRPVPGTLIMTRLSGLFTRAQPAIRWRWAVLFIFFVGFGLRLFQLGHQELRGDEAFSYVMASRPTAEIIPALLREGDPHSPFHYLLLDLWLPLTGDSEFAMRFISLLPGALTIPLVALSGRFVSRQKGVSLLAAFLVAISESLVWVGQDVRNQYTLATFFTTLATFLLLRLTQPGSRAKAGHWVWYALSCAAAVYSHYYAGFVLLAHGLYMWRHRPARRQLRRWLSAGAMAFLLFVPWLMATLSSLVSFGQSSDPSSPELARYLARVGVALTTGDEFGVAWGRWLFLGAMALGLVGACHLFRRRSNAGLLLGGWLVGVTFGTYLVLLRHAVFNGYHATISAPAWWLLIAAGMGTLWQNRQRARPYLRLVSIISLLSFVIIAVVGLRNYYFDQAYSRSIGYREMAAHVAREAQPDDLFLAHFPDPALVYYLRHVNIDYEMQPARFQPPAAETETALAALTAAYDRVWFVPHASSFWDRENVVPNWLALNTLKEQDVRYNQLSLFAIRPSHALATVTYPINNQLGDSIRLEAVLVTVDGLPVDLREPVLVRPGAAVTVNLIWEAVESITAHYTVFVQLLDENGQLVAQHDGVPVNGVRPTMTWQAGERLIDAHTLTVPPDTAATQGQIIVGMYRTETVERLLFADGQDATTIATVQFVE